MLAQQVSVLGVGHGSSGLMEGAEVEAETAAMAKMRILAQIGIDFADIMRIRN